MAEIRVLGTAYRSMQRLGYLKRLVRRVVALSTSSLENLGNDLTSRAMEKSRVPLNSERTTYIRRRLTDRVYGSLKGQVAEWQEGDETAVAMELQDLYLADPTMPSHTGKLRRSDGRKYTTLVVGLGLVRAGTYSPNTRGLSFLHFTPKEELAGFLEYLPDTNPFRIHQAQALLLLYAFLENDGEVVAPILSQLRRHAAECFSDREAGDCLPEIYRSVIRYHRRRLLSADERERLESLEQIADSIEQWRRRSYTGGGAHIEAGTPRVEPYVDMGLLEKPNRFIYKYRFKTAGLVWAEALDEVRSDSEVSEFLTTCFFSTAARAWELEATAVSEPEVVVPHLYRAWKAVQSAGGYAPIEEMALVAGIEALLEQGLVIEPAVAREAILAYQKENPYKVRFTVNRMGVLAHARFLEEPGTV